MPPALARLVAAALLVGCAGCSFVAVRRAPASLPPAPDAPVECTESRTAPVLDTVGAIATPVVGLTTWFLCSVLDAMQSWSSTPQHLGCGALLWGTALGTAAYTGSAVYGYRATGTCRRLVAERSPARPPDRPSDRELPARPLPANLAPGPPR